VIICMWKGTRGDLGWGKYPSPRGVRSYSFEYKILGMGPASRGVWGEEKEGGIGRRESESKIHSCGEEVRTSERKLFKRTSP